MLAGADAVYCSGGLGAVEHVAREHIPVVGHVGLVPSRATWTGGMKAVAKTATGALALLDEVRAYESAGAFAVEIEVVPVEVATEISRRVGILLWSMGAGPGFDAQYLFAADILGINRGHMPRHSKVYRNFAAEYDRMQAERIAAFREFAADVAASVYPEDKHVVRMNPAELAEFHASLKT
jgi:3-methyl-2-oxobutanoate hydroxymethyltransferase